MRKITVLIIDDSSVIRSIINEVLKEHPEIEVIGEAKDPFVAREEIKRLNPDVLTLDVEMPKMDGITFLSNLMRLRPMPVLMLSTLTTKGADVTLQALELGAIDFIAKPSFEDLLEHKQRFKNNLVNKIKFAAIAQLNNSLEHMDYAVKQDKKSLNFIGSQRSNHLIAIGASTGGTEAIKSIITKLPANAPPVVITLHIPEKFSLQFALRMNAYCAVTVQEAKHGQKIKEGNVYIAPGDKHLMVESKNGSLFCVLDDSGPVNRHKPSVDVLFESLQPFAANIQAILLTGMGQDGASGMLMLKNHSAMTIIQDKNSSLVWGMPGKAYDLGAHVKECSLSKIPVLILENARLNRNEMKEVLHGN